MTTAEIAQYYANLLILEYLGMPNAYAAILATVTPILMDQLPIAVQNAFDVNTAVGVQLDVVGKYVGVSRINTSVDGKPVTLDDDDFRIVIRLVILSNNSGSSLATIQSLLQNTFPGQIFVSDNRDMSINYVILETLGSATLLSILATGAYLPAPMGVGVGVTIVPSHTNPFFGFITYNTTPTVSPFNNYAFYQLTYPWLSY